MSKLPQKETFVNSLREAFIEAIEGFMPKTAGVFLANKDKTPYVAHSWENLKNAVKGVAWSSEHGYSLDSFGGGIKEAIDKVTARGMGLSIFLGDDICGLDVDLPDDIKKGSAEGKVTYLKDNVGKIYRYLSQKDVAFLYEPSPRGAHFFMYEGDCPLNEVQESSGASIAEVTNIRFNCRFNRHFATCIGKDFSGSWVEGLDENSPLRLPHFVPNGGKKFDQKLMVIPSKVQKAAAKPKTKTDLRAKFCMGNRETLAHDIALRLLCEGKAEDEVFSYIGEKMDKELPEGERLSDENILERIRSAAKKECVRNAAEKREARAATAQAKDEAEVLYRSWDNAITDLEEAQRIAMRGIYILVTNDDNKRFYDCHTRTLMSENGLDALRYRRLAKYYGLESATPACQSKLERFNKFGLSKWLKGCKTANPCDFQSYPHTKLADGRTLAVDRDGDNLHFFDNEEDFITFQKSQGVISPMPSKMPDENPHFILNEEAYKKGLELGYNALEQYSPYLFSLLQNLSDTARIAWMEYAGLCVCPMHAAQPIDLRAFYSIIGPRGSGKSVLCELSKRIGECVEVSFDKGSAHIDATFFEAGNTLVMNDTADLDRETSAVLLKKLGAAEPFRGDVKFERKHITCSAARIGLHADNDEMTLPTDRSGAIASRLKQIYMNTPSDEVALQWKGYKPTNEEVMAYFSVGLGCMVSALRRGEFQKVNEDRAQSRNIEKDARGIPDLLKADILSNLPSYIGLSQSDFFDKIVKEWGWDEDDITVKFGTIKARNWEGLEVEERCFYKALQPKIKATIKKLLASDGIVFAKDERRNGKYNRGTLVLTVTKDSLHYSKWLESQTPAEATSPAIESAKVIQLPISPDCPKAERRTETIEQNKKRWAERLSYHEADIAENDEYYKSYLADGMEIEAERYRRARATKLASNDVPKPIDDNEDILF